jgi:hypothetical protein
MMSRAVKRAARRAWDDRRRIGVAFAEPFGFHYMHMLLSRDVHDRR